MKYTVIHPENKTKYSFKNFSVARNFALELSKITRKGVEITRKPQYKTQKKVIFL